MADKPTSGVTPGSEGTSIKKGSEFEPVKGSEKKGGQPKTLDEIRANQRKSSRTVVAKPQKKDSFWRSIIYAVLIALIIRAFFIEAFRIPTGSMKNTLLVGDYLFVNKLSYFLKSPKYIPFTTTEIPYFSIKTGNIHRGDVIVFEYPGDKDVVVPREKKVNYIKRCIGLPGDTIQVINKQVYVNGQRMENPSGMRYLNAVEPPSQPNPSIFPRGAKWNQDNYGPIRIPKKGDIIQITKDNLEQWEIFIEREGHSVQLGDNGVVQIDGKTTGAYTVQRDYLWMMGDNRDDSEDSRFWGFAPVDNVVGQALFIYWSWYRAPSIDNPSNPMPDGYDPEEEQTFHIRWDRLFHMIH